MPLHPIPAMLLARLPVGESVQGDGIWATLLADAMQRELLAAEETGIRRLLVLAVNEDARSFYLYHAFERSHSDPMNLQLLTKGIRATVEAQIEPGEPDPGVFNFEPNISDFLVLLSSIGQVCFSQWPGSTL